MRSKRKNRKLDTLLPRPMFFLPSDRASICHVAGHLACREGDLFFARLPAF